MHDQENVKKSLDNVVVWCKENGMELNVLKCQVVSFHRGSQVRHFNYTINGASLQRVESVKDLGVYITSNLNSLDHIANTISRANSLIGFIFRSTRNFHSPNTLVCLYKSLVRPILEYGSIIWSPCQLNHIGMLDGVQDRFLRLLGVRLGFPYRGSPVDQLSAQHGLQSLHHRRRIADLVFLYKLVNGTLDCPSLLQLVDFAVPRRTRSLSCFRRKYQPTNYSYNTGLSRLIRYGAEVAPNVDFFWHVCFFVQKCV